MVDESLEALRRAAEVDGSALTRLRYAQALRRAGRPDEAVTALLPVRADVVVRHELAKWPVCGPLESLAGCADVPPLMRSPRLAWFRDDLEWSSTPDGLTLCATPCAVVVADRKGAMVHLLDPDTGARRRSIPGTIAALGDLLFVDDGVALTELDAWSGKTVTPRLARRREDRLPGIPRPIVVVRRGAAVAALDGARVVWRREDVGGSLPTALQPVTAHRDGSFRALPPIAFGGLVLVDARDRTFLLDRATGATRATLEGWLVTGDRTGVLLEERVGLPDTALVAYDVEGRRLWQRTGWRAVAVLPQHVVAIRRSDNVRGLLARATGAPTESPGEWWHAVTAARGNLYFASRLPGVTAFDLDAGRVLWELPLPEVFPSSSPIQTLAPGHRRLYVLGKGRIAALEEA